MATQTSADPTGTAEGVSLDERHQSFAEVVVITFLAGAVAEARHATFRNPSASGFDLDMVLLFILYLAVVNALLGPQAHARPCPLAGAEVTSVVRAVLNAVLQVTLEVADRPQREPSER